MGQCGAFLQFLVDTVHFGGGVGGGAPPWTPSPLRSSNTLGTPPPGPPPLAVFEPGGSAPPPFSLPMDGADGAQGGHPQPPPPPRDREQQGAAGWLRDGQGQGASPPLSDQRQQDAAGQGLGQQGAAGQGLGQQAAAGQGLGQQNAAGQGVGQQDAAGQGLGQQGAAGRSVVQAQGQPEAAALGQGCQGQGQGRGQGGPAPPLARHSPPPPPLPSWGGSTGAGARQCDSGGQGSAWGRPSGAPLAAQGCGSPFAAPRGGALEPWLHSASAVIGRGGAPNPPQPHLHLRARMGERTARGLGRVTPQRIPHRTEARVLPSHRDTLGGRGGVRALYICIQLYIDELSPANPLIPSIALASRT